MGATLPFIEYYSLSTLKTEKGRTQADARSESTIDRFVKIITDPSISAFCLSQKGFLYNGADRPLDKWLLRTEKEPDSDQRDVLYKLIEDFTNDFTVVVPNFDHIKKGNMNCKLALETIAYRGVPIIDAEKALMHHGNKNGVNPIFGIESWIFDIKSTYLMDRDNMSRSKAARGSAAKTKTPR